MLKNCNVDYSWEHINLTGDYILRNNKKLAEGKYRALRSVDISQYKKSS